MRFMRRMSRQGLAKRGAADPAVLKRDPRYGQRLPSHALNQGSKRAVHAPHVKTGACEKSDRGTCRLEAGSTVWTTAAFPCFEPRFKTCGSCAARQDRGLRKERPRNLPS